MRTANKKAAFTLVELMFAALASAILILTVTTVSLMGLHTWRKNNAYISLRRDAAFAMEMMARDIREARPDGLISKGTDILTVRNYVRGYVAYFTLNPGTGVIDYSRDGGPDIPLVAGNVGVFWSNGETNEAGVTNRVRLHLEMVNTSSGITIANETDIHMRN
jgi:type II secretory pathway pseudopilin PulG